VQAVLTQVSGRSNTQGAQWCSGLNLAVEARPLAPLASLSALAAALAAHWLGLDAGDDATTYKAAALITDSWTKDQGVGC